MPPGRRRRATSLFIIERFHAFGWSFFCFFVFPASVRELSSRRKQRPEAGFPLGRFPRFNFCAGRAQLVLSVTHLENIPGRADSVAGDRREFGND